jgi:catechol 1,2-dioxygenase
MKYSRREFLRSGAVGLAAAGLGAGGWLLRAEAEPTEPSGELGGYGAYLDEAPLAAGKPPAEFAPTEPNIRGPFYREGAPFRGKITPPLSQGTVLLISGRVWGHDTRQPLANAILDIWQANHHGRYDNDDPRRPPAPGVFRYRARLVSGPDGYYEYETIHPGRYQVGRGLWRPSHIHYMVGHPGYRTLVTQLYFKGDPMNATDPFIRESLIIELKAEKTDHGVYQRGVFDIVLARA